MVDVELLPPGERAPRTLLVDLMLEGSVGDAFLDVAVPGFGIGGDEALRMLLQSSGRSCPWFLWRSPRMKSTACSSVGPRPLPVQSCSQLREVAVPVEQLRREMASDPSWLRLRPSSRRARGRCPSRSCFRTAVRQALPKGMNVAVAIGGVDVHLFVVAGRGQDHVGVERRGVHAVVDVHD